MEPQFYNALNIFYQGNYSALKRAWETRHSWTAAWQAVRKETKLEPEKEWERLLDQGIELRLASDDRFPTLLKEMPWSPFALYIKGTLEEDLVRVGIVGTRRCTAVGKSLAHQFAKDLTQKNVVIVSGLAIGIDGAAHQGALDGNGKTIAVLAGGLDYLYPRQHVRLAESIVAQGGALVSEYAKGAPAFTSRFIERNRIVSGLSSGVIVIEAPIRSGSLATARFALDQNRTVFVTPGPATSVLHGGSHDLIRSGAALVTNVQQVLEELGIISPESVAQGALGFLDEQQQLLVSILKEAGTPLNVDALCMVAKLPVAETNQQLTLLVIQGVVKEQGGNYFL